MKSNSATFVSLTTLAMVGALSTFAFADAGVFAGNGQSLHQISTKHVQLVSIDVTIGGFFAIAARLKGLRKNSSLDEKHDHAG